MGNTILENYRLEGTPDPTKKRFRDPEANSIQDSLFNRKASEAAYGMEYYLDWMHSAEAMLMKAVRLLIQKGLSEEEVCTELGLEKEYLKTLLDDNFVQMLPDDDVEKKEESSEEDSD